MFLEWSFGQEYSSLLDPPGHGRIGGHYFHTWCPSVRHKSKNSLQSLGRGLENKTTYTMRENNDRLLAVAGWVILNSLFF